MLCPLVKSIVVQHSVFIRQGLNHWYVLHSTDAEHTHRLNCPTKGGIICEHCPKTILKKKVNYVQVCLN